MVVVEEYGKIEVDSGGDFEEGRRWECWWILVKLEVELEELGLDEWWMAKDRIGGGGDNGGGGKI